MWYFEDRSRVEQLKEVLESWIGTPFRHHCGVKGLGTDCIHFVLRVFQELEVPGFKKIIVPDYPPDWHLHNSGELLMGGIESQAPAERIVNAGQPMDGDILLFRYGRASSHSAIYCEGNVYQAMNGLKVSKVDIRDDQMKRCTFRYRIKA